MRGVVGVNDFEELNSIPQNHSPQNTTHTYVGTDNTLPYIIYVSVRLDVQETSTCPRTFRRTSKRPKIPGCLDVRLNILKF